MGTHRRAAPPCDRGPRARSGSDQGPMHFATGARWSAGSAREPVASRSITSGTGRQPLGPAGQEVRTMNRSTIARRLAAAGGLLASRSPLLAAPQATLATVAATAGTARALQRIEHDQDQGKARQRHARGRVRSRFEPQRPDVARRASRRTTCKFFTGNRVTQAPSGSFTVRKLTGNPAGTDTLRGRATNLATGEVCRAHVRSESRRPARRGSMSARRDRADRRAARAQRSAAKACLASRCSGLLRQPRSR